MINYHEFTTQAKSLLIAPAGFGKTYTIAASILELGMNGRQLILTHTHAGVAAIKEKLKEENILGSSFQVETITGFAQKFVLSFYTDKDVPAQTAREYYPFIIRKAIELFQINTIQKVISTSYSGLFVDEYQDCTKSHHQLISLLSCLFPTRLLGDPLQGIFGFKGDLLVDMEDKIEMASFLQNIFELTSPQRWLRGNNEDLGENLKDIRRALLASHSINLNHYKFIESHIVNEIDLYNPKTQYYLLINRLLSEDNLLIIHPDTTSINSRLNIIKLLNNRLYLLESIDDKDFYNLSKEVDNAIEDNIIIIIKNICLKLFNKTEIDKWFNNNGLKRKTKIHDQETIAPLKGLFLQLERSIHYDIIATSLKTISNLPSVKCYRKDLFYSLLSALRDADINGTTVYDAMINHRNAIRRHGRKVMGKSIGTTLLTKGLEFDTVVILNAHKFECPKHLYVALTRASKRLVVFANNSVLNPKIK